MDQNKRMREQLLGLLRGRNAHASFEDSVANVPMNIINENVRGYGHSLWDLMEHLRLAQWDILDFMRNPEYKQMNWPEDYWPDPDRKASAADWDKSLADFRKDMQEIEALVQNPDTEFFAPLAHAPKYTIFREILVIADHNAYHVGQMVVLRQHLGAWGK